MAHVLVNDVLREIFLHLVNPNPFTGIYTIDDLHNLYQCILVNRTWCSIAIPILWSQPFHFLKEKPDSGTAVINMYLKSLDEKEIDHLSSQGIDISLMSNFSIHNNTRDLQFQQSYSEDSDSDYENEHRMSSMEICEYRRPPMFNYPGFLRSMWYETMVQAIEAWCLELSEIMNPDNENEVDDDAENTAMNEREDKLIDNAEIIVMKSVLKLCLNKGARLNCLFLHPDRLDELNDELYEMLLVNEEFKDLVSSIKTLEINGMIRKNNVYLMLSKRCRKLECLYIHSLWARNHDKKYVDNFGNAITTLITSQHSLRYFTLSNCKAYARAIVPPLIHQSSSLRYIRFENVDFRGCDPWESVAECKRMELLEVYECSNLNEEMVAPVINARFGKEFEARYVSSNQCQKFEDWVNKVNCVNNNNNNNNRNFMKGFGVNEEFEIGRTFNIQNIQ
ncbi:hypothetical protein Glove_208g206 [Diversispora epigaea]|uniref:F-box domain-containing protein n=1 Tax=Diversispora epigaea TaxID=1348612 RepID=A0A397ITL8_9GLOM|nr:hypothetical protein Glove_208g206 [Diversispora epigaea]